VLRRFLYLNRSDLSEYVAALEGGLASETSKRSARSGSGAGGVDVKLAHASGERSRQDEESQTLADTDEARFDRLLVAAAANPEALGWVEVVQPDVDFADIGIGAMVSWECDLYIPDVVQSLARSGDALTAINLMQRVLPAATVLGIDTAGLPGEEQMRAAADLIAGLEASLLVVGEDEETDLRVAGQVVSDFLRGDLEGRARVVGKVSQVVRVGRWKRYLTFPGMRIVPREERRRMERERPAPGSEAEYLAGPALVLDLLAIYR
jgi:hypothetical protein